MPLLGFLLLDFCANHCCTDALGNVQIQDVQIAGNRATAQNALPLSNSTCSLFLSNAHVKTMNILSCLSFSFLVFNENR